MRILLDENFPKSAADVIAAAGHEVISFAALRQPNRKAILTRLEWFFENFDCQMANRVFILRGYSCRAK